MKQNPKKKQKRQGNGDPAKPVSSAKKALPKSKVEIRSLNVDIPSNEVAVHLNMLIPWVKEKLCDMKENKIFNEAEGNFEESKRLSLCIDGRTTPIHSKLLNDYLLPYLKRWGKPFNLEVDEILLLISEAGCLPQLPHVDDCTGSEDFINAIYTLYDDTNFLLKNEVMKGQPVHNHVLCKNTLVLFHSSKVHGGGANDSDSYNLRYHFRLRHCGVAIKADSGKVGFPSVCKWECGFMSTFHTTLVSHEYKCYNNPDGKKHEEEQRLNEQRRRRIKAEDALKKRCQENGVIYKCPPSGECKNDEHKRRLELRRLCQAIEIERMNRRGGG